MSEVDVRSVGLKFITLKMLNFVYVIKLKPPLPEEDYPVDTPHDNNDTVFTTVQHTHTHRLKMKLIFQL